MWLALCQRLLTTLSKGGESYLVLSNDDEPPKILGTRAAVTQCCRNHILARLRLTYTPRRVVPSISSTVLNSTGIDRAELERSSNGRTERTDRERLPLLCKFVADYGRLRLLAPLSLARASASQFSDIPIKSTAHVISRQLNFDIDM